MQPGSAPLKNRTVALGTGLVRTIDLTAVLPCYEAIGFQNWGTQMGSLFDLRITLDVIVALAVAIVVLRSLVYLNIQPASLTASVPSAISGHSK